MPDVRKTSIVATIGPACDAPGVLDDLVAAGIDVARLNASHAGVDELGARMAAVRAAATRAGRHVAVLLDLPGPKVRVGPMAPDVVLACGASVRLVPEECIGTERRVCVTHPGLAADLAVGDRVLIDDGAIELSVTAIDDGEVVARVEAGGPLRAHKGVNVPRVRLSVPSVSPHDLEVLAWGLDAGVDMVAQSFVRRAADVAELRAAMGDRPVPLVAKIEKHEALGELDAIIEAADAVMVARGDLAVETAAETVPPAQRRIVMACRATGTPVIVATQMLESMVSAPRPTRAEASDVATAVFEGADAVMLSAETAVGAFPAEAAATMDRICRAAEDAGPPAPCPAPPPTPTAAVASAAVELAAAVGAAAIVTATQTGASARAVAARRPDAPVLAMTTDPVVARRLALVWGVLPHVVPPSATIEEMTVRAETAGSDSGLAAPGDRLVLTAGTAVGVSGSSDLVRVLTAGRIV